ncbi:MAG: HAMP domain-containing sensor histidine kinase [Clostridia bacterium]|nr:HAMP domain-containing sensor histidine kinase [Clostridia bacterium]
MAMMLLVLLLFPAGTGLIVSRCFELTMARERERALSEEAAIARAMVMELGALDAERVQAVAESAQARYGSQTLSVYLVRDGEALAGEEADLPEEVAPLLTASERATLLLGKRQTLYIAHRLGGGLTLLLGSDVSPVYSLRRELTAWAAALLVSGVTLAALLAAYLSGVLTRPVCALARAAKAIAEGAYDTPLPRARRDETGELTRAFAAMIRAVREREDELREQAGRRQELIDALAHEMRTPLTAIVGGARLMQHARLEDGQRDALLETMAREAMRLSAMDERLLTLTRLDHETPRLTSFSSMEMAREALDVFEGVELLGEDARFTAERELTILLMRNLVVNAQRAGGSEPVRVVMKEDGFAVEDCGCGMTPEQAARAFDPFYKADKARSRNAGGAGLGLTLCRKIAQLHGGALVISSRPGLGTRVVYSFDTSR